MNPTAKFDEQHRVSDDTDATAYVYLVGVFSGLPSRKSVKKALKAQRLIDVETGDPLTELSRMRKGMVIGLMPSSAPLQRWDFPLKVVYEDDHVAVVFKPAGVTTGSTKRRCLKNALLFNLRKSTAPGALRTPLPVHRLDHATEGLVICAKTGIALTDLGRQFEAHTVEKQYIAEVVGHYSGDRLLTMPIEGKSAITKVLTVQHCVHKNGTLSSRLLLQPLQGRTHQIRIHLSSADHPIVGDRLYGTETGGKLRLKACRVRFSHPVLKEWLTVAIQ